VRVSSSGPASRGPGVHKVGLAAAAVALASLLLMPFAVLRTSRIATGSGQSLVASVGAVPVALLLAGWLAIVVLSLSKGRSPWRAAARSLAGASMIVAVVALSVVAAVRLSATRGAFARVSIGGGAWAAIAAAYIVVVSGRRQMAGRAWVSRAVQLVAPAGIAGMLATGSLSHLGIMREYANWAARFWTETATHLAFTAVGLTLALAIGSAIGVLAFRHAPLERPLLTGVSLLQTIPGLAMIGILFGPLNAVSQRFPALRALGVGGLGWAPVITALTLYALLVVVHDVVIGLRGVSPEAVDAARGMGMTPNQLMRRVRLPLAAPVVYTGMRTAALQTVGTATLGAFVAAGTLGLFITQGLAEGSSDLVLLGALTLVVLALALDAGLRALEPLVVPAARRLASKKGGPA
jgi:osmoprotectant transport system permease protein